MNVFRVIKSKIRPLNLAQDTSLVKLADDEKRSSTATSQDFKREQWTWPVESVFTLVGYSVNLVSIWTFPTLCMRHGGVAFMIPCVIFLLVCGIPLYFLDISLGQRSGQGVIGSWQCAPLFQGIGYASVLTTFLVSIYYNIYTAWSIYYLAASFTSNLPWSTCKDQQWYISSFLECSYFPPNYTQSRVDQTENVTYQYGLLTKIISPDNTIIVVNNTYPSFPDVWRLPAEDYFHNQVLKLSTGFEDINGIDYELVLCLILGIIICIVSLSKAIKSAAKVITVLITVVYCILLAIFVRALQTNGVETGLRRFFYPNWIKLQDFRVWGEAGLVMFFMLFVSWGNISTMASYNGKNYNKFVESFASVVVSFVYAIMFGMVISSLVGILSFDLHVPIENLLSSGPSLLFVTVAQALTKLQLAPFWSSLFYFCVLCVSITTLLVLIETIVKSVTTCCAKLTVKRLHTLILICIIVFFASLGLVCKKGLLVVLIFQNYASWWNVLLLAFFELCIAVVFYKRIFDGCQTECVWVQKWRFFRYAHLQWRLNWSLKCALVLGALLLYSWYSYIGTYYGQYKFPVWAEIIGWLFTCVPLLFIPIVAVVKIFKSEGGKFIEKLKNSLQPHPTWNADKDATNLAIQNQEIQNVEIVHEILENGTIPAASCAIELNDVPTVHKIAATEYSLKPGNINRATQTTRNVRTQTGEVDDNQDESHKHHRKHKHKHRHKETKPHRLAPLKEPGIEVEPKVTQIEETVKEESNDRIHHVVEFAEGTKDE